MEKMIPIIDIPYNTIASRVLVCGDPYRAEAIAKRLDNMQQIGHAREYWTYNGTYKGVPVTISSHGVGAGGASVSFEGLILGGAKCMIRIGTCGTMREDMPQGSLIIATAACREDGVSAQLVPLSYPAVASYDVVAIMQNTAAELEVPSVYTGLYVTGGAFYPGVLPTNNRTLQKAGAIAYENEAAMLFVICGMHGVKTGCIAAADGPCFEFVGPEDFNHYPGAMEKAKENEITIALESIIKVEV